MASRNGLSPKIRGPKGIGFGRALPGPFGFDNGYYSDGIDDNFNMPTFVGEAIPSRITIEFWVKTVGSVGTGLNSFGFKSNNDPITAVFSSSGKLGFTPNNNENFIGDTLNSGGINHIVFTCDFISNKMRGIINGNISHVALDFTPFVLDNITQMILGGGFGSSSATQPMDEFRFYNVVISDQEIITNYNAGIGANPSITEHLLAWYQFERFETLDFSALQDNSDMRLGMRDMSGMNNHAQPMNMQTNPDLPNYVLQSFL